MSEILVTGASGWLGRHCVSLLSSKGYTVHAVSRRQAQESMPPNVIWHGIDLRAPGSVTELIRRIRPDRVLHLAWYAEPGKFWNAGENLDWVRVSLELLGEFAEQKGKRIVSAGSCAEYRCDSGECLENSTPLVPDTLYGTSKHAVERLLHCFGSQTSLSHAWGRIFFLYGPREHPSRLVAYVVRSLLSGEPAQCSDGTQILDFMHVEDAASAFVALLESDAQGPVNIGSGTPISIREVLQEIGTQIGRPELIQLGAVKRNSGSKYLWANVQKLAKETAWFPRYTLTTGLQQTIEWWRNSFMIPDRNPIRQAKQ